MPFIPLIGTVVLSADFYKPSKQSIVKSINADDFKIAPRSTPHTHRPENHPMEHAYAFATHTQA